jgi:histidinol-phosphatase (PHP family)
VKFRDYHVHLEQGPYTIEWIKRFMEEGKKRGIAEIGFSEHGHRFVQAKGLYRSPGFRGQWTTGEAVQNIEEYIEIVEKAKSMGFPVKLGIEMDYIPECEAEIRGFLREYPFDYVLGSIHWIGDFGFDNPEMLDEWNSCDVDETYLKYFDILLRAVESGMFDCIAHPDVIKVFGHRAMGDMSRIYELVAKAMKKMGIFAEVNTAGLRKPAGEMYPSPLMMEYFAAYKVPVMINSDAHRPEDVGRDFDKAIDFVKHYGYESEGVSLTQPENRYVFKG